MASAAVGEDEASGQARRWLLRRAAVIFATPAGGSVPDAGAAPGRLYCWMLLLLSKHSVPAQSVMPELVRLNAKHGERFDGSLLREALQEAAEAHELVGGLPRQRPAQRPR